MIEHEKLSRVFCEGDILYTIRSDTSREQTLVLTDWVVVSHVIRRISDRWMNVRPVAAQIWALPQGAIRFFVSGVPLIQVTSCTDDIVFERESRNEDFDLRDYWSSVQEAIPSKYTDGTRQAILRAIQNRQFSPVPPLIRMKG